MTFHEIARAFWTVRCDKKIQRANFNPCEAGGSSKLGIRTLLKKRETDRELIINSRDKGVVAAFAHRKKKKELS